MSTTSKDTAEKIKSFDELLLIVEKLHLAGKKIVTTNGCFDLVHPGHVETFEWAALQGDILIVGINSDASVRENKTPRRPIIGENDRARVVAGLQAVDYVFIFNERTPIEPILRLRPSVHVKGGGSINDPYFQTEKKMIEDVGGELRLAPFKEGKSTTNIIKHVVELEK